MLCMQLDASDVCLQSLVFTEIIMHSMKKRAGSEWIAQLQYPAAKMAAAHLLLKIEHDFVQLDSVGCIRSALLGCNRALEAGGEVDSSYLDCFKLLLSRGATVKSIGELVEKYPLAVAQALQGHRRGRSSSAASHVLNLCEGHLPSLPKQILDASHQHLIRLDFSSNDIEELPPELFDLPLARVINVSHNKIRKLPAANTWKCNKLTTFNVSNNLLTGSPEDASRFSSLITNTVKPVLSRVANFLQCFSSSSLFKGSERRASADHRLDKLHALANVNISNNKLQAVPTWITLLPNLKSVNFSGNDCLTFLPPQLVQYSRDIISINVDGLKLISPPMSEVRRGSALILCYLNSQLRNAVNYRHMRLMLVGSCAVGKTTLVARLKGGSLPKNLSTVGIDLSVFSYKPSHLSLNPQVTFHTLDFAGQEDYYATHQCFFTKVAVYLALFDLQEGKAGVEQLKPWLLSIQACAPGAVVIIVGTHLDILMKSGLDCNEIRQEIETQFCLGQTEQFAASHGLPHVIDFFCVSSLTGFGVPQLKRRLYQAAFYVKHQDCPTYPFFNIRVPACHLFIQECLENKATELLNAKRAPVLTKQQFESLVTDNPANDIRDTLEVEQASRFLHELGALLHYENASGELQNLYFINLQFLSRAMACVVTSPERSLVKNGILHFASLQLLFKGGEVPAQLFREFMQLMQHFEVAIPLDKEQQIFLIPAMLHRTRPVESVLKEVKGTVVGRRWSMKYVPVGFWSRLISRITVFAHAVGCTLLQAPETLREGDKMMEAQQTRRHWYCWQRGLAIIREDGSFLVLEDAAGLQGVDVFVAGDVAACGKLLSVSGQHMDTLLQEFYPGLSRGPSDVQKLAYCPKCLQESWAETNGPGMKIFDDSSLFSLTDFLEKKAVVSCSGCEAPVSLREIAPDLLLLDLPSDLQLQAEKLHLDETDENCIGEGGYGKVKEFCVLVT